MNPTRSTFGLSFLFLLIFGNGIAQKVNYTTNSGIMLGIGAGETHQNSDIPNSSGFAFDVSLGSYIIKKENALLSADWKFRFLNGENTAFDHRINSDNTYSNVLYSFSNYDLELGLTLNRLRERTRIIVSGFAGVGLTGGRTFTDLYDSGNNLYDFSGIDPNRDQHSIYDDLVVLSDGDFETELTNRNAFLPTAGLFMGYQISPAISLGFEFKTNFYLSEENSATGINLDNRVLTGSAKDRNSYLNVSLSWALKPGSLNTGGRPTGLDTPINNNITNNTNNTIDRSGLPGPSVNITQPKDEVSTTATANQTIKATIYNVTDPGNISFFQNGFPNNSFAFNPATKTFTASVRLRDGENDFRIKATNRASSAEDRVQIILEEFREEKQANPYISFTSPTKSNSISDSELVDLTAIVKNISRKEDIQLTLNGSPIPFQYDPVTGLVRATTKVAEGESRFHIRGRNETGSATDHLAVNFSAPVDIPPPVITFINPSTPVQVENMRFPLEADIQHVESRNDITILRNGEQTGYFSFRPNGVISLMVNLTEGTNIIEITAANAAGSVTNSTSIYYNIPEAEIYPPEINIYYPEGSPLQTIRPGEELRATILNISSKDQVNVYLNGSLSRDFYFNNSTKELLVNVPLREGSNVVSIKAQNRAGTDLREQVLVFVPQLIETPCETPSVTFFIEETGISGATHVLKGTVTNVRSRNGITITLDGRPFNGFQYFPSTGILNAKLQLGPGSHRVVATARNECGDDRFGRGIDIEEPCVTPDVNFDLVSVSSPGATHLLQGNVSHVENKDNITMTVDGASFNRFQFMPASETLRARFNFGPGSHTVLTTVRNECGTANMTKRVIVEQEEVVEETVVEEETIEELLQEEVVEETEEEVIIEKEEEPCNPPSISITIEEGAMPGATHVLGGIASNVKNKSEITMTLDGNTFNGFQFVPTTGALSAKFKLEPGTHAVVATVKNECGSDIKTSSVIVQEIVEEVVVEEEIVEVVEETIEEVVQEEVVEETVEDVVEETVEEVVEDIVEEVVQEDLVEETVVEVEESIVEEVEDVVAEEEMEVEPCGVRINPGNSSWQFCLVTAAATYTRDNLKDKDFSYTGSASSLYFMPTGGGGAVTVSGSPFQLKSGQYYLFSGNIQVTLSTNNPGSTGKWSVCINTDQTPVTGTGNNRPDSPCAATSNENKGGKKDKEN